MAHAMETRGHGIRSTDLHRGLRLGRPRSVSRPRAPVARRRARARRVPLVRARSRARRRRRMAIPARSGALVLRAAVVRAVIDTRRQLVLPIGSQCRAEGSVGGSAPTETPPGPSRDGPSLRPWTVVQHTIDHPSGRHAWRDDVCARCLAIRRDARPYRAELPCSIRWIYQLADGTWSAERPICPGHALRTPPKARAERGGPGGVSSPHSGSGAEPRREDTIDALRRVTARLRAWRP